MRHFIPYQKKKIFQCLRMRSFCCLGFKSILHSEGNENILFYNSRRFIILFLKQKRMWFINEPKTYFKFSLTSLGRWAYQGSSRCAWGLLGGLRAAPQPQHPTDWECILILWSFFILSALGRPRALKAEYENYYYFPLLILSLLLFPSGTQGFRC